MNNKHDIPTSTDVLIVGTGPTGRYDTGDQSQAARAGLRRHRPATGPFVPADDSSIADTAAPGPAIHRARRIRPAWGAPVGSRAGILPEVLSPW